MNGSENKPAGRRSWFFRFFLCCLSFLIVVGILALVFYMLGMEPFGRKTVSIDDAKIQYIDFFTYYVDVLRGVRPLTYDFSNMLGGSSIGLFSYYLASPFNLLLYFFGKDGVYRFFNVAAALKLGTAGATFSWYLQRRFEDRIRPVFVLSLSMGYALMQYSIAQSSNIMWLDGVYMLPLILLGVYETVNKRSVWRLSLTVGFCILCNWYIAGVTCLFTGLWFLFEFFFCGGSGKGLQSGEKAAAADGAFEKNSTAALGEKGAAGGKGAAPGEDGALGALGKKEAHTGKSVFEKKDDPGKIGEAGNVGAAARDAVLPADRERRSSGPYRERRKASGLLAGLTDFIVSSCRYVWGMGLGVALSAVLFLPAVSAIRQGKGQYEEIKVLMEFGGDLLSSVRGYVIGAQSERGFAALFCGGIAVFAAAAFFFSWSIRIREKIAYLALVGACFLMLHWEPAMLAFSLFKRADSYWYRYSYLVCFALLFGAGAYLSRAKKDRWSRAFIVLMSLLYGAAVLKLNGIHLADFLAQRLSLVSANRTVFVTAASSAALSVLTLFLLCRKKGGLLSLLAGLLVIVLTGGELWANAMLFWSSHRDDSQALYRTYSAGLQKQLEQLRALDSGYYRIAQDRTRWHYEDDLTAYFNDSLAQNYWSNAAYTSSPENTQLSLMWRLGYRDEAGCMLIVRDTMLAADSFLGVKYLFQSAPLKGLELVKEVEPFNGRSVYRNPFALPFAFTYDGTKLPTMRYDKTYIYQNKLYSTLTGRETTLFTPLPWTRKNEGNKAFFRIYVPKGNYLVYGNLLWPEKMSGLMSINGGEPFGYSRWMSPAAFLIRSRKEQAKSGTGKSLQAIVKARAAAQKKAEEEAAKALQAQEGAGAAEETEAAEAEEVTLEMKKEELQAAAQAFDREAAGELEKRKEKDGYADVRTVVFRTEKGLSFKDYQFFALDLDALREASERIRSCEVTDLTVENGHVECSVDGRRGQSVCLLVPWSKGWRAHRNGEVVQPDTVAGTMITVPLVDGENHIELDYTIPYLREGMAVSAAALAVLLFDILYRWAAQRKKRKAAR